MFAWEQVAEAGGRPKWRSGKRCRRMGSGVAHGRMDALATACGQCIRPMHALATACGWQPCSQCCVLCAHAPVWACVCGVHMRAEQLVLPSTPISTRSNNNTLAHTRTSAHAQAPTRKRAHLHTHLHEHTLAFTQARAHMHAGRHTWARAHTAPRSSSLSRTHA